MTPPDPWRLIERAPLGSTVTYRETIGGESASSGTAQGASGSAVGDNLSDNIDGTAPTLDLGEGFSVSGGAFTRAFSGDAFTFSAGAWSSPFLWGGILLIVAAFGLFYMGIRRAAVAVGLAGLAGVVAAIFPALAVVALIGVGLYLLWPVITADKEARDMREALGIVAGQVERGGQLFREQVKDGASSAMDRRHKAAVRKAKRKAGV